MEKTQSANQQEIELIFGLPKIDHVFVDVICVYRLIIMNHPTLIMKRNHEKKTSNYHHDIGGFADDIFVLIDSTSIFDDSPEPGSAE